MSWKLCQSLQLLDRTWTWTLSLSTHQGNQLHCLLQEETFFPQCSWYIPPLSLNSMFL